MSDNPDLDARLARLAARKAAAAGPKPVPADRAHRTSRPSMSRRAMT